MKYILRQINEDFLFEELEETRKQFIEALNFNMQTASIVFDKGSEDPLDFYIVYDFGQASGEPVIYGFNLRDELIKNFKLDVNQYHSSQFLLEISQRLQVLSEEMEARYVLNAPKSIAEIKDQQETEYAKNINRSYADVLKDAIAKDEAEKRHANNPDWYANQTILLGNNTSE